MRISDWSSDVCSSDLDGIRDAGGIPIEFPVHPIFENCRRPTAAIDRNLLYLGLVELLNGYPIDGVVLTTGCDKTTPSQIMAASTVDIPAIVLRSEEHTSELQSLMRTSYAVFCLKQTKRVSIQSYGGRRRD